MERDITKEEAREFIVSVIKLRDAFLDFAELSERITEESFNDNLCDSYPFSLCLQEMYCLMAQFEEDVMDRASNLKVNTE